MPTSEITETVETQDLRHAPVTITLHWIIAVLPTLQQGLWLFVARATHWSLYVLMLLAVTLGVLNIWACEDSLFNLMQVPRLHPGDRAFIETMGTGTPRSPMWC